MVFAVLSAAGCVQTATTVTESSVCDIDDLRMVYAAPEEFFGKTFCGEAFARLDSSFEIFLLPSKEWKSEEGITLVLATPSNERLRTLWGGRKEGRIRLQARLDGIEACFKARTVDEECVPYSRPIVFVATQIERTE